MLLFPNLSNIFLVLWNVIGYYFWFKVYSSLPRLTEPLSILISKNKSRFEKRFGRCIYLSILIYILHTLFLVGDITVFIRLHYYSKYLIRMSATKDPHSD